MLSGIVKGREAVELIRRMLNSKDIDQVSFPMLYFLFRALENTGLYEEAQPFMRSWGECLSLHLLTMPEQSELQRSRWSALPLYEFTSCFLGVTPREYGRAISIKPLAVWVSDCAGQVVTPSGIVKVHFWRENGKFHIQAQAPPIPVYVQMPDGTNKEFPQGGYITLTGNMIQTEIA